MSEESASGQAVAERVRAANIAVGGNSSVEAMLANSLRERKPLADTGKLYNSVQSAVSAAGSFVFVPPGTFNESVTIDTAGLTLLGSGRATLIDGDTSGNGLNVTSSNVTIKNLSVDADESSSNSGIEEQSGANNGSVENVFALGGFFGIGINNGGQDWTVKNCYASNPNGNDGIRIDLRGKVIGCTVDNAGDHGINIMNDDCVVASNIVTNVASIGILLSQNDAVVGGNRVHNSGDRGIITSAATNPNDCIIYNNRISDSTNADLNTFGGSGHTTDSNLTGPSN